MSEVVQLLEPEGIDYFVFRRKDFYPEELAEASFFKPLDQLVHELTRRHYTEYAYRALPREVDLERFPYMPFRDRLSVVVDIAKLKAHLAHEEQI